MLQPEVLNLNAIIRGMEAMLRRLIREDIGIAYLLADDLYMTKADAGQLEQVVMNLALNARDAMPSGGRVTIETANVKLDGEYWPGGVEGKPGRYVMLAVSDTGVGMDEKTREHIFEPFFTTKELGKGTGLGLATVYGIVKQSEGQIAVYSEPGHGTIFRVYLPTHGGPVTPTPKTEEEDGPVELHGDETILFAEDDVAIRMLARQILDSHGYKVLIARNGREALKLSDEFAGKIDLLVTDTVMPELNGRQLSNALAESRPETKVLFVSGYTDNVIVHHGVLDPGIEFLQKPFTAEALLRRVRRLLKG
jgi:two-component system, cell cycle sensor histidine kinase and response regulator CckA